ncbi:MAG TPA: tyrosine-type recombinase/integrase [Streptosporangiaceae bacterium]
MSTSTGPTAVISQQLQQHGGHLAAGPPKTRRGERAVALDRTTVAALRRHRAAQDAERAAAGPGYHDSGYVFTGLNGDPMAPDRLSRRFRQLSDQAGLPPVRLHDLRHGAASLALAAGAELKTVQDQLGHSSIVLTADTYISVLPDVARQAAEDTASLVLRAGYLVPGTRRTRRKQGLSSLRLGARAVISGGASLAHPGRQIGHLPIPLPRASALGPARDPAIPRPTSGHTRSARPRPTPAFSQVRTGANDRTLLTRGYGPFLWCCSRVMRAGLPVFWAGSGCGPGGCGVVPRCRG